MIDIGKKIKELRKFKGLTQQEMADLININSAIYGYTNEKVSRVSITRYENGSRIPSCYIVYLISKTLDISVSEFFKE